MRSGPLIASKRNRIVAAMLDMDPTPSHLLMVDTDIGFRFDDLECLLADDLPVVSALYVNRNEDGSTFPVGHLLEGGEPRKLRRGDIGDDVFPVAGVGMGFCLIRRDVLEALAPIRALWPFAETEREGIACGEDLIFSLRATDAGFTCYIDPAVEVDHVKEDVL